MIASGALVSMAIIAYGWVAIRLVRQQGFRGNPVLFLYLIAGVGSVVMNLVATVVILGDAAPRAYAVYATFVIAAAGAIMFTPRSQGLPALKLPSTAAGPFLLPLLFVPFLVVSARFAIAGLESGAGFGTPVWRAAISETASGYEYLIYGSGAVLLSALLATLGGRRRWPWYACVVLVLSLSIYGGRFLVVAAFAVGLCLRLPHIRLVSLSRSTALGLGGIGLVIAGAFLRYAAAEGIERTVELLIATVQRQLAGSVYDFWLSNDLVEPAAVRSLIVEKFRVGLAPMLTDYREAVTLGDYLATAAGRSFEGGHRISAVGEAYYLAGFPGVVCAAVLLTIWCRILDMSCAACQQWTLTIAAGAFGLLFTFFIDASYVFTAIYLTLYLFSVGWCARVMTLPGRRTSCN
jgi:hypothetical protein